MIPQRNFTDADMKALVKEVMNQLKMWAGGGLLRLAGAGLLVVLVFLAYLGVKHA